MKPEAPNQIEQNSQAFLAKVNLLPLQMVNVASCSFLESYQPSILPVLGLQIGLCWRIRSCAASKDRLNLRAAAETPVREKCPLALEGIPFLGTPQGPPKSIGIPKANLKHLLSRQKVPLVGLPPDCPFTCDKLRQVSAVLPHQVRDDNGC